MRYNRPHLYLDVENFRMVKKGDRPTGLHGNWTWSDITKIGMRNSVDNHKKVLRIIDDKDDDYEYGEYVWDSDYETGSLELWIRADGLVESELFAIVVLDGAHIGLTGTIITITENNFIVYNNLVPIVVVAAALNTWYHLYVEWDCNDKWSLEINGTSYGPYDYTGFPAAMDRLYLGTSNSELNHTGIMWVDALDFSFTTGYFKNRNKIIYSNIINRYNVKDVCKSPALTT
jgi:hypothetical protein